jgi:SAM-dependent methyltransferase
MLGGMPDTRRRFVRDAVAGWDAVYADDSAPWDIGRPQAAFVRLADAGEIRSPVLDSGCGTGEHALMLATRGHEVVGIDLSAVAVERARRKAAERNLAVTFQVGDVLDLAALDRTFATIVDNGVFHVFDDDDRARYVRSLAAAAEPGCTLHLMCFSEHTPGTTGPRRVTQAELREAFAEGWRIERIEAAALEVRPEWAPGPAQAWLARILRQPRQP